MNISVLMPAIRNHLLKGVYDSLVNCFHGSWELVVVSPNPMPVELRDKNNIVWVKDYGSPIRCRQIGLLNCNGDYICYAADDVTFYPNSLDIAFKTLQGQEYKNIVVGKYMEHVQDNPTMRDPEYWRIAHHQQMFKTMEYLPKDYKVINTGLMTKKFMFEIGGWDCQFECCAMACMDLSIRLQNAGAKCVLQDEPIFHSTWLPNHQGDHGPIHDAQIGHDEPLIEQIYATKDAIKRTIISLNTWEQSPERWSRRFS